MFRHRLEHHTGRLPRPAYETGAPHCGHPRNSSPDMNPRYRIGAYIRITETSAEPEMHRGVQLTAFWVFAVGTLRQVGELRQGGCVGRGVGAQGPLLWCWRRWVWRFVVVRVRREKSSPPQDGGRASGAGEAAGGCDQRRRRRRRRRDLPRSRSNAAPGRGPGGTLRRRAAPTGANARCRSTRRRDRLMSRPQRAGPDRRAYCPAELDNRERASAICRSRSWDACW